MGRKAIVGTLAVAAFAAIGVERKSCAQSSLQVRFGDQGVQQLSYNGIVLEDLASHPSDAFHIWHMKLTDLKGKMISSDGWGETNAGKRWDAKSQTWIYKFAWGSISVQFVQSGNTLDMNVTERNSAGSGVILDGAVIYPLALHLPQLPANFYDASYAHLAFNTNAPSVTVADYGSGQITAVVPDAAKGLYSGFQPAGQGISYSPIISGTAPDNLATFQPHIDRPVAPGQTDRLTVSLRFAPSGTPAMSIAADAYASWARTWPAQLAWTDRRVIGTVYLASSPMGDEHRPGGYANNPRRYFNEADSNDFDVRTLQGIAKFQAKVLQQAQNIVQNLHLLHAQGAITWDLEGEQYPQNTSYVCAPDQIATVAPEMESVIANGSSLYGGMKLDDAYFKIMRDAGFRVGVCIRPQHLTVAADGSAQQVYLADAEVATEILRKMRYAHDRWGATLFYLDSTVESNGAVLDAGIVQKAAAALPDSLLIPEESTPKEYAYVAPFKTFLFHGDLGTDAAVYGYYPHAFSANLINDVDPAKLAAARAALTNAVKAGDILMTHADYWQANNPTVVQIYKDAGGGGSSSAPTPAPTPSPRAVAPSPNLSSILITSPVSNASVSGVIAVKAQVNVSLDAAGSYLMVDGTQIGTRHVTASPFRYALDTSTLRNGQHALQIWGHDTANVALLSGPVTVTVANSEGAPSTELGTAVSMLTPAPTQPIQLPYPANGTQVSGVVPVRAMITPTLGAAGSYLTVDRAKIGIHRVGSAPFLYALDTTVLPPGPHTLQIWAHNTADNVSLSNQAFVTVSNQAPLNEVLFDCNKVHEGHVGR